MSGGPVPVAAVIGSPIAHSLSPVIHRAAFEAAGLDWSYVAFDVAPDKLDDYLLKLRSKGVAVTDITNHANSLAGGHKRDYDPETDAGDVFVRSLYFKDPNGTLLEFASWTTTFDDSDVEHVPARARTTALAEA